MGRRLVHLQVGWPLGADVQRWSPDGQWPLRDELLTSVPLIDPVAAKSARVHVDCAAVFGSRLAAGAEAAASGCARTPRGRRERTCGIEPAWSVGAGVVRPGIYPAKAVGSI